MRPIVNDFLNKEYDFKCFFLLGTFGFKWASILTPFIVF